MGAVARWIGQIGKVSLQRIAVILVFERQTLEDDTGVAVLVEVALLIVGDLAEVTAMISKDLWSEWRRCQRGLLGRNLPCVDEAGW